MAQIEEQLSAYTGRNATGYLKPLADAFGADLNAGLFNSAHIPHGGFHLSLELVGMSVYFADEDRSFLATTENGFSPEVTTPAPTVIGSRRAVAVEGDNNTKFFFPGGFDLTSFSFASPQLRIGAFRGTEAVLRFLLYSTGSDDLGELDLYGIGVRHSVSQYFGASAPVDVAASFFWQAFSMGQNERGHDLIEATTASIGLHASRRFSLLEPYAGLSYDTFSLDVSYQSARSATETLISYDSDNAWHLTLGLSAYFDFVNIHGEYNISGQNVFAVGLGFKLFGS